MVRELKHIEHHTFAPSVRRVQWPHILQPANVDSNRHNVRLRCTW